MKVWGPLCKNHEEFQSGGSRALSQAGALPNAGRLVAVRAAYPEASPAPGTAVPEDPVTSLEPVLRSAECWGGRPRGSPSLATQASTSPEPPAVWGGALERDHSCRAVLFPFSCLGVDTAFSALDVYLRWFVSGWVGVVSRQQSNKRKKKHR